MLYEKTITVNLGNYESVKIGVSEANRLEDCDEAIWNELKKMEITISPSIRKALNLEH